MSILVDATSRIAIQGITGRVGRQFAERMIASGTPLVCGVSPGKAGQRVLGVPVFDSASQARAAVGANCSLVVVPPMAVAGACEEVILAGVETVVSYTEGVPVHDSMRISSLARRHGVRLFGPNSAGVISPGRANLSDLADHNVPAGRVGIVSKSGTLTYEVLELLRRAGLGASTVVCLGGDEVVGTLHADVVPLFLSDDETDCIVLVGEIGGQAELQAVCRWHSAGAPKPLVAYVAGHAAPPGRRLGHAGAIIGGEIDSAAYKSELMSSHGAAVARVVTDIPHLVSTSLGVHRAAPMGTGRSSN